MPHSPMSTRTTHLAVLHVDTLSESLFADFLSEVEREGLQIEVESYEQQVYGGIEWLLPTVAAVYISKAYFDGFLGEMGKDHYALLKKGLRSLWGKLLGPGAPRFAVISTPGKVSKEQPYSLVYSVVADAAAGCRFKLLFPRGLSQGEYNETLTAFLDFLRAFHRQQMTEAQKERFESTRVVGKTILLVYDATLRDIRPLDPLPKRADDA
jgi:hypothetical protein